MTAAPTRISTWEMIHRERARLAADLAPLGAADWERASLCAEWTVEDVVAHLTAAATTGRMRWLGSMLAARFDPAVHNRRRLLEQRGPTPADTLARFRAAVDLEVAASGHTSAWLGEVVVHGTDVRRPLAIPDDLPVDAVTEVARFFASRDFTVEGRTRSRGLRLVATDGRFAAGEGPLVEARTLALVMVLAGRVAYLDELSGPGAEVLQARVTG